MEPVWGLIESCQPHVGYVLVWIMIYFMVVRLYHVTTCGNETWFLVSQAENGVV